MTDELTLAGLIEAERAAWRTYENAQLDKRVAERDGGDIAATESAIATANGTWYDARKAAKEAAAKAVRETLGVDPAALKGLL